jgi:ferric-dicitrate binding protein FerR (iron transport regulator)
MAKERLQYLLKRKLGGHSTAEEVEELARLVGNIDDEALRDLLREHWDSFSSPVVTGRESSRRILESILEERGRLSVVHAGRNRQRVLRLVAAAASLLILTALGSITYRIVRQASAPAVVITAVQVPADQAVSYNRYIELPDGSSVLLKAGSTLGRLTSFDGASREVALNGEAYFDIARDTTRQFVIHTGKVKTVVLGTAFNIKAWDYEDRVTVSVTRGKVKVENEEKVLAVLTANQQVQFDRSDSHTEQKSVAAEETVTGWTRADLIFKGESLESIANVLSRRFGVNISISDPDLAGTVIVSSFSGTESLENILDILCKITGDADFIINGNEIAVKRR